MVAIREGDHELSSFLSNLTVHDTGEENKGREVGSSDRTGDKTLNSLLFVF